MNESITYSILLPYGITVSKDVQASLSLCTYTPILAAICIDKSYVFSQVSEYDTFMTLQAVVPSREHPQHQAVLNV